MNWTPQKHAIIKSDSLRDTIYETGWGIEGNLGIERLNALKELYKELHQFSSNKGGMFYSLYSNDITYRRKVHDTIGEILYPLYDTIFSNYKSVINSFIVKVPGPESEFTLHQDSSGLDEMKYSALSLWIPLQDTNMDNGCLCVVPKSHKMFYPYRGISFPTPFQEIDATVRRFLVPIDLKAGDVFMFDNRLVHYSPGNKSNEDRVIVMSGLFPKEATIQMCYRDESVPGSPYEIYEEEEDYLLTNTKFFHDCTCRPELGTRVAEIKADLPPVSEEAFLKMAAGAGLTATNIPELMNVNISMNIISEPV